MRTIQELLECLLPFVVVPYEGTRVVSDLEDGERLNYIKDFEFDEYEFRAGSDP
jgi:hypothetical protein